MIRKSGNRFSEKDHASPKRWSAQSIQSEVIALEPEKDDDLTSRRGRTYVVLGTASTRPDAAECRCQKRGYSQFHLSAHGV
jgi:hypothetical protein